MDRTKVDLLINQLTSKFDDAQTEIARLKYENSALRKGTPIGAIVGAQALMEEHTKRLRLQNGIEHLVESYQKCSNDTTENLLMEFYNQVSVELKDLLDRA